MARSSGFDADFCLKIAQSSGYHAARLSKELSISPRQLRRYTHKAFGRSPQNWLDELRLIRATLLLETHRSVKTVAFELGFKQVSHFSREFKLFYGVPPSIFLTWSDHLKGRSQNQIVENVRVR